MDKATAAFLLIIDQNINQIVSTDMAAEESSDHNSLKHTPTWAVSTVFFFIIFISICFEHSIRLITNVLKRHRKTALFDALDRLKSELMLVGFMSLLLAVTQNPISDICISKNIAEIMLPCQKINTREDYQIFGRRNLLTTNGDFWIPHRSLMSDDDDEVDDQTVVIDSCTAKGKVPLMTSKGIHQLKIFITVLAVMQIVYSAVTVSLGQAKMWRWEAWEKETQTTEYLIENDPNRFNFSDETIFGKRHDTCTETSPYLWIKCFFRQFFHSVAKVDYQTLRHSFIMAHLSSKSKNFNFQKYIQTSLEEDFKVVVSIRTYMWCIVIFFLLVNVHGWHIYYKWISFLPFLIVVLIGAKLETIVARMALRLKNQKSVIIGNPVVEPHDDLFWFKRPRFVLSLLHLSLFLNAFELAFFIWVTIQFGWDSCYHENLGITVTKIGLAVLVHVMCSYITLPLYALVTQMGSEFKRKVLEEQMAKMLKQWHGEVRAKRKKMLQQQQQAQLRQPASASLCTDLSFRDIPSQHNSTSTSTENNLQDSEKIIKEEEEIVEV